MTALGMITVDTTDARRLSAWWAERLGGEVVFDAEGWFCVVSVPGWGTDLGFQYVEEPSPGKNRLHLDLVRDEQEDREAAIAAWTAAGAVHLGLRGESDFQWDTFEDPDGNEFCIAAGH
ncbi:VOC family protein [Brevibacterium salitolerans]|uniref:VOC family protein n=1 Tax=Brevibacterium salitolerans TaxID=1403566 RepID=A0ABN2WU01_9MICO